MDPAPYFYFVQGWIQLHIFTLSRDGSSSIFLLCPGMDPAPYFLEQAVTLSRDGSSSIFFTLSMSRDGSNSIFFGKSSNFVQGWIQLHIFWNKQLLCPGMDPAPYFLEQAVTLSMNRSSSIFFGTSSYFVQGWIQLHIFWNKQLLCPGMDPAPYFLEQAVTLSMDGSSSIFFGVMGLTCEQCGSKAIGVRRAAGVRGAAPWKHFQVFQFPLLLC